MPGRPVRFIVGRGRQQPGWYLISVAIPSPTCTCSQIPATGPRGVECGKREPCVLTSLPLCAIVATPRVESGKR